MSKLGVYTLRGVVCCLIMFCEPLQAAETFNRAEQDQLSRLQAIGYAEAPRLYIRIFKEEKTLEIWVGNAQGFKLYRSVAICRYSGKLGPKLQEGDAQAPEGFYYVPAEQILWNSAKWPRALNLAFPNIYDANQNRTGSNLLIHGGCSSKGCFAIKDGPMEDIYALVSLAIKKGQTYFPLHIFPFRFTTKNWQRHKGHKWAAFWRELQPVYDKFNRKRDIPDVLVCEGGYQTPLLGSLFGKESFVLGSCVRPLPVNTVQKIGAKVPAWALKVAARYPINKKKHKRGSKYQIKVACNLKRPSCKRWLFLRQKMLRKGTLPKELLRP